MLKYTALLVIGVVLLCQSPARAQQDDLSFSVDIPYRLTAGGGESHDGVTVKALVAVENTGSVEKVAHITVSLPAGMLPSSFPTGWQADANSVGGDVRLSAGYGEWFDLLTFDAGDLTAGEYTVAVTLADGDRRQMISRKVTIGEKKRAAGAGLSIASVVLPVDRAGNLDGRMSPNTLILRDKLLDYYKSVLRGKGAYNEAAEAVHPLTSMNVEFINPGGGERLLTVVARFVDRDGRAVPGLFTPAASIDERESSGFGGSKEGTTAFIALTGAVNQTVRLPVYIDEDVLAGGQYILRIEAREDGKMVAAAEEPVAVIARDSKAAAVTLFAVGLVACGLAAAAHYRQRLFGGLKTRWLITITLFGAVSFAVVNVPATLLGDILHVFLGPLAFLATGMFHGIVLYMLVAALVVLIPRPGVVSLLFCVRMLLGLLAFGHASPVALLLYGSQAVLLETLLFLVGITSGRSADRLMPVEPDKRHGLLVALACSAADGICTYLNLHALSFLYRVFYANWYICAAVVVNGILYSGIGGFCGVMLGNKLRTVGSD